MKLTQEDLTKLIEDQVGKQVEAKVKAQGVEITEKIKDSINEAVKTALSENVDIKKLISPANDNPNPTADPKAGFKSFSEFALAVKNADVSRGQRLDDRLKALTKAAGTSLHETDVEYGGYLIPEEFRTTLFERAIQKSNIMQMCTVIPMATNAVNIPYVADSDHSGGTIHGGIQFYWLDEEGQKTETRPKFGKIQMRLKKMAGLVYASDEILEDSPVTLEPLLNRMFSDAMAWQLDYAFINGVGAGMPLGILNSPCKVSITAETGQASTTILYENIIKMYARMWNKSNAVFMANDDTFKQLAVMNLAVGTGGAPVYLPANGAADVPYDRLMGKPLVFTEHCQTLGTEGDIIFCDWTQYLVGQKSGSALQFASSIHLKFDYDQTAFRFVFRVDGQPWWPAALTPRHSSDQLSPFVTIASR